MATKKKLFLSAAGAAAGGATTDVDDVFATNLWTGNSGSQIIDNGIKLSNTHDGGSAKFPGTSGLVVPDHAGFQFGTGNWTIEAWVFPTADSDFVVCSWGESTGVRWDFGWQSSSNPRILVNTSSSSQTSTASSTPISGYVGQWVHMACVRNGSDIVLYVNGVAKTTMSYTGTSFPNPSTAGVNIGTRFFTGQNNVNNASTGFISDFRIVKGTAVYTSNFTPSTSYLSSISGTSFLGLSGDTPLVDASGNSHSISQNSYNSDDVRASEFGHVTGDEGAGGLVWTKQRTSGSNEHHYLLDTARTAQYTISTNTTGQEVNQTSYAATFNAAGYQLYNWSYNNDNNEEYVGWTFRKAEKFFDIVQYSGNGSAQTLSHNLGSTPGVIMVKRTDSAGNWRIFHRSSGATKALAFTTGAEITSAVYWNNTAPTSTQFTIGTDLSDSGSNNYIAYLFAHNNNDGEFGPDADQDIIECGDFTTDGSENATVTLGFEPQWILWKQTATVSNWMVFDVMRGLPVGAVDALLEPNANGAETAGVPYITLTPTGFNVTNMGSSKHAIFMAIRRGPLATPTDATKVFNPSGGLNAGTNGSTFPTNFPVDTHIYKNGTNSASNVFTYFLDRLRGEGQMIRGDTTSAETHQNYNDQFDHMDGMHTSTAFDYRNWVGWNWKRAPGFFDVVTYKGTAIAGLAPTHNLGVVPEMIWVKNRSSNADWYVYHSAIGNTKYLKLNTDDDAITNSGAWNNTSPTSTQFTVGDHNGVNGDTTYNYIAYLFATVAGVSKVGSYTGNGSDGLVVDCGFTGGARFVLIRLLGTTGDWFVFDTERGIVTGSDPHLRFNTSAATGTGDWIDPHSSGFIVNNNANVNVNGYTHIFYAIA